MIVEKRKTVLLFILFACTLFLTGKFVLGLSAVQTDNIQSTQDWEYKYDVKSVFKPKSYIISFSGGIYTKDAYKHNDALWEDVQSKLIAVISEYNFNQNPSVLGRAEWQDVIRNRGVYFSFPFKVSFSELCNLLEIIPRDELKGALFDGVWLSIYEDEGIYLSDRTQGAYYKFENIGYTNSKSTLANIVGNIETENIIEYRLIEDLFSLSLLKQESESIDNLENQVSINNELFPVTSKDIDFIKIKPEFTMDAMYESLFKSFAQKSFGKNFSFVKKMKDVDESIIYIYGYANKALRIGSDGSVEYTKNISKKEKDIKLDFAEAIKKSIYTIDMYGGVPDNLYLSNYNKRVDDINRDIWTLDFDCRIAGMPIVYNGDKYSHSVHIEIVGGQVSKFFRKIYLVDEMAVNKNYKSAMSFNDILDVNSDLIQKNYLVHKPELAALPKSELWIFILRDIANVDVGYIMNLDNDVLYPVWKFSVANDEYNFPLYKR